MGITYASLGGVGLDVTTFRFPIYRGFELRTISFLQGTKRFAELDLIAKNLQEVKLDLKDGLGNELSIPVRIIRIEPRTTQVMEIYLVDRRFELLRHNHLTDFNINMADQVVPDIVSEEGQQGKQRIKEYLPGTASAEVTVVGGFKVAPIHRAVRDIFPIKVPEAIERIFTVIKDQYSTTEDTRPILNYVIDPQSDIGSIRVPDRVFTAGTKMMSSLEAICGPAGIDMWVDYEGTFHFTKRNPTLIPLTLKGLEWKEDPAWELQIGANYHKPKTILVPYVIKEEIEARTRETTEARPAKIEFRLQQIYIEDNDTTFNGLLDFIKWVEPRIANGGHRYMASNATCETMVNDLFFSGTWVGSPLQLNPNIDNNGNETQIVQGLSESARSILAQRIVAVIENCWRQTYRVIVVGPEGEVPSDTVLFDDLPQPLGAQGYWSNVQFGSIKIPIVVADGGINNIRDPDDPDAEGSISETDFLTGGSVISKWADNFKRPLDFPEVKDPGMRLRKLRFWRNNEKAYAPFNCFWISQKRLMFKIVSNVSHGNIAYRVLGNIRELPRVVLPGDEDYRMLKQANMLRLSDPMGAGSTLPQMHPDEIIRVRFTGTRRAPQGKRTIFNELKVDGFSDGEGTWSLSVDPTKFALFPLGENGAARTEPINLKALQQDAEKRVNDFISKNEMNAAGSAWAHGISVIKQCKLEYALNEMTIEYGFEGPGTMLTRVDVGQWQPVRRAEAADNKDIDAILEKMANRGAN